jgi:hypothetical protein
VRKSFEEMVAEELLALLVLLVLFVPVVALAIGVALAPVKACPAVVALLNNPANAAILSPSLLLPDALPKSLVPIA